MKTILTLALTGLGWCVMAQAVRYPLAIPYSGLAAYSIQQKDALSFTGNQAALAGVKNSGIGLFAEKRFMQAGINTGTLAAAFPSAMGNFGLQLNYTGVSGFSENKIGIAYARSAGSKVDIGLQFNYYGYRIPAYGAVSAVYAEAGAIFHLSNSLSAGVHVYNPAGAKLGKQTSEKLPTAFKFGIGYDASTNFFAAAEIIKEEDKPVNVTAGFQYQFSRQFFARAGILSETTTFFAGIGAAWKNFRADIAGSYHPQLGISPGVLLLINLQNKSK